MLPIRNQDVKKNKMNTNDSYPTKSPIHPAKVWPDRKAAGLVTGLWFLLASTVVISFCWGLPSVSLASEGENVFSLRCKDSLLQNSEQTKTQQDAAATDSNNSSSTEATTPKKDSSNLISGGRYGSESHYLYIYRNNRHQATAFGMSIILLGIFLLIGLLKLSLHVNHLTHGNYAGRLQFWGVIAGVLITGSVAGVLFQVPPPETSAVVKLQRITTNRSKLEITGRHDPQSKSNPKSSSDSKTSSDSQPSSPKKAPEKDTND